jgi:hypothetical protein
MFLRGIRFSPYGLTCAGYRTTAKLLTAMLSPVADDTCPRKLIVKLCVVFTEVTPRAAANAVVLPQLSPLQGCVEAFTAKLRLPANAVSAAVPVRDSTGVPPKATCGVNPELVPVCVK